MSVVHSEARPAETWVIGGGQVYALARARTRPDVRLPRSTSTCRAKAGDALAPVLDETWRGETEMALQPVGVAYRLYMPLMAASHRFVPRKRVVPHCIVAARAHERRGSAAWDRRATVVMEASPGQVGRRSSVLRPQAADLANPSAAAGFGGSGGKRRHLYYDAAMTDSRSLRGWTADSIAPRTTARGERQRRARQPPPVTVAEGWRRGWRRWRRGWGGDRRVLSGDLAGNCARTKRT